METVKLLFKPRHLVHERPHQHFKGKWQKGEEVSALYLIYQLAACAFLFGNLVYEWIETSKGSAEKQSKYLIYLTHWGIVTINLAVVLETLFTLYIYCKVKSDEKLSKPLDKALHISWGISHATYSAAVFITALYWSLLYKDDAFSYLNLYVHGLQGGYSVLDQVVSARSWEGGHWWVCLPMPLVYVVFSVIYWAAGGTNEHGNDYIYNVLDWSSEPGGATGLAFGAFVLLIVIHYFFVLLTWTRDKLHAACFKKDVHV